MFLMSARKPWILPVVLLMLVLGLVPLFTQTGATVSDLHAIEKIFAEIPVDDLNAAEEIVDVGVYILSVGNLDTTTGKYYVDFFLNFKCRTPNCEPGDFDIMNSASPIEPDDQTSDEDRANGERYYRIKAEMQSNLDLRNFPFDEHTLTIELEDKNKDEQDKKFIYVPSAELTGIDPDVYVSGWTLKPIIKGDVRSHVYEIYEGESYSRARFSIQITHSWFSSFMKGLFAAIVIVAVGMLSFLMNPDEAQDRINLTSGTLASAIFYHMTLTASIPPVGYLTYADRFMILQYVFTTAALAISIALFLLESEAKRGNDYEKLAGQIHQITRWAIPLLWIVSMVIMHLTTIGFPVS